jgi:hypothetical protein
MELETFTRFDADLPRITCLEPGWETVEPDEDLPFALVVHVALQGDSESGIPETDEQHDAMVAIADALGDALSRKIGARFVGIDTTDAMHAFHFQIPRGKAPGPTIADVMRTLKTKVERVECFEDPDWDKVLHHLFPDSFDVAMSDAMMTIWTLEDEGEDLSIPRAVRHTVLLPDQARFDSFKAWAEPRGYAVTKGQPIDELGFLAHATRVEAIDPDAAIDEVEIMVEETMNHDGTYVEWECAADAS